YLDHVRKTSPGWAKLIERWEKNPKQVEQDQPDPEDKKDNDDKKPPKNEPTRDPAELNAFKTTHRPFADEVTNPALKLYQQELDPRIEEPVEDRNPRDVNQALKDIPLKRKKLEEGIAEFQKLGPFKTKDVEEARKAALAYMVDLKHLLDVAEECLQKGKDWTADDKKRLTKRWNAVVDSHEQWRQNRLQFRD